MERLSKLAARLKAEDILEAYLPGRKESFDRLVFDSRDVGPNDCFVAIRGADIDGHMFIDKAVKNGAIAIVCEAVPVKSRGGYAGTAFVHVTHARKALSSAASMLAGDPGEALIMVATTGTNGKTTTASLVRHVLEEGGIKTGFIGTTGYSDGTADHEATHTTPSPARVYDLLAGMRRSECGACSMEVSSHALDQHRVRPGDFDAAIFTNLTRDHLDYHGTEEAYQKAKKRLFDGLKASAVAVVNKDDPYSDAIVADTEARVISFGVHPGADVRAEILEDSTSGLRMRLDGEDSRFRLAGRFNAWNIAAAYAAGLGLGVERGQVAAALEKAAPVPGRFELLRGRRGKSIIVDYAHTPDALENVLRAAVRVRQKDARLWCVFGCGGDRDRGKRPVMGRLAEELADGVIVTSDNPRTEDPESILRDIRQGMSDPDRAHWIADRREAIVAASDYSDPGDIVLIAGKGHETYQVIGTERVPFDDRKEVRLAFCAGSKADRISGQQLATLL